MMGNWDCEECDVSFDNRAGYTAHITFNEKEHKGEKITYELGEKRIDE